jgi:hypothetical protein
MLTLDEIIEKFNLKENAEEYEILINYIKLALLDIELYDIESYGIIEINYDNLCAEEKRLIEEIKNNG